MLRNILVTLSFVSLSASAAEEPETVRRSITDAKSVLAIYREDWGLASSNDRTLIFVAWPDGLLVWSENRIEGGPPYRTAQIGPRKIDALLDWFEKDGVFANDKLKHGHFGPDSEFTTILIKNGKHQVKLQSWHELIEQSGKAVADDHGISGLRSRRRLDVLRESKPDYLYFRFVWSETRGRLMDLIPGDAALTDGKLETGAEGLFWNATAGPLKPE